MIMYREYHRRTVYRVVRSTPTVEYHAHDVRVYHSLRQVLRDVNGCPPLGLLSLITFRACTERLWRRRVAARNDGRAERRKMRARFLRNLKNYTLRRSSPVSLGLHHHNRSPLSFIFFLRQLFNDKQIPGVCYRTVL